MFKSFIDLHTHTTASDGTLSPVQLVKLSRAMGLAAISITDHDTIDGLSDALDYASKLEFTCIPGIELSAEYKNDSLHLLGYYIDYRNPVLTDHLKYLIEEREQRNHKIVEKLNHLGLRISIEEVQKAAKGNAIGRPHIASVLLKKNYVKNLQQAFKHYLGKNGKAYVERVRLEPEACIDIIHQCGGIAVLAHPCYIYREGKKPFNLVLKRLIETKLDGIEVYYSDHTERETIEFMKIARKNKLLITGGTDFHGDNKPYIKLAIGRGNLRIPFHLLQDIQNHFV